MNTQSNAIPESSLQSQGIGPIVISPARRMYWSVRRELWEHRSIYIAPLAAAAVVAFGFLISTLTLPHRMRGTLALDLAKQHADIQMPYELAAALIMGTAFIVGIFYSLDALYGERRDRSILFWKSLPVSDLTAVLSKVMIPLFILPGLSFVIAITVQFFMLVLSSVVVLISGLSAAPLWTQSSFVHTSLILLYHIMTVHGLLYAPIYGWLLLVSAWAPRAPFIWAFLPPFVIWGVEKIAFNTSHFLALLEYFFVGPKTSTAPAPDSGTAAPLSGLVPAHFFSTSELWIGLAIAAALLAAAARLRRYRGPI